MLTIVSGGSDGSASFNVPQGRRWRILSISGVVLKSGNSSISVDVNFNGSSNEPIFRRIIAVSPDLVGLRFNACIGLTTRLEGDIASDGLPDLTLPGLSAISINPGGGSFVPPVTMLVDEN